MHVIIRLVDLCPLLFFRLDGGRYKFNIFTHMSTPNLCTKLKNYNF